MFDSGISYSASHIYDQIPAINENTNPPYTHIRVSHSSVCYWYTDPNHDGGIEHFSSASLQAVSCFSMTTRNILMDKNDIDF